MKVKVCGITSLEDAAMCEELGADAIGFVHVSGRKRSRALDEISDMCGSLGPMTTKILVCRPRDHHEAERMFAASGADVLQLHSLEPMSLDALRLDGIPVIRAVLPSPAAASKYAPHANILLFEKSSPGTGSSYDYSTVPVKSCERCIIAGGLNSRNVGEALRMRPYALDVSSGVESSFGRKDPELVSEFIRRCKA
ncbi:MAG: phosphoribosylanthranilate isomerase [Candidatus Thermoplasmatota archaeon]